MGAGGVCLRRDRRRRLPETGIRSVVSEEYVYLVRLRNCSEDDSHRIYGHGRQMRRTAPSDGQAVITFTNANRFEEGRCGSAVGKSQRGAGWLVSGAGFDGSLRTGES